MEVIGNLINLLQCPVILNDPLLHTLVLEPQDRWN